MLSQAQISVIISGENDHIHLDERVKKTETEQEEVIPEHIRGIHGIV